MTYHAEYVNVGIVSIYQKNKKEVVEFIYGSIGKLWVLFDFTVTCFMKWCGYLVVVSKWYQIKKPKHVPTVKLRYQYIPTSTTTITEVNSFHHWRSWSQQALHLRKWHIKVKVTNSIQKRRAYKVKCQPYHS